jgi:hypothetical protein
MSDKDEAEKYADIYLEIIESVGKTTYDIDDLYAAFLSGWSNCAVQSRIDELNELVEEVKAKIRDEFSDA